MASLVSLYQQRLNLQDANFSRIDHEDAMVAIVYKITQTNGKQFILKISERINDYLREVYFLEYFAHKLPVPRIIQVVQPADGLHGAVLMECLPGALLNPAELTEALAYEIGSLLARIHLNRTQGYGDLIEKDKLSPDPRIYFTLKFEEGLDECSNHLPKALIEQCRHFYDTHLDLLTSGEGPCIVHRDFRPGNLIVLDGKLQGVIDWVGARSSFAQEDFCSIENGDWTNNPNTKKAFLEGYASIRTVPDYREVMPLLRLSKAVATIGFTVKRGTWNSNNARLYRFNRQFLETFLKSIDLK